MLNDEKIAVDFVIKYWDELQEEYKTQFNHFMGVFEFWIGIIGVASSICLIIAKDKPKYFTYGNFFVGIFLLVVGILAFFVTVKMFDIRGSQYRYIWLLNSLSKTIWKKYKITHYTNVSTPFEKNDLLTISKHDFGIKMAWTMSFINSFVFTFGIYLIARHYYSNPNWILMGALLCVICIAIIFINVNFYYVYVVKKIELEMKK